MKRYQLRLRRGALFTALILALGACSSGPPAPPIAAIANVCASEICVDYPDGWDVAEVGGNFISFTNPASSEVVATVGPVNMEAVVAGAGGAWPQAPRNVVDDLWRLIDGGEAELVQVELAAGGALDSWGLISTGRMWHRLVPLTATEAWGIEIRGPDGDWEPHADVFRRGFTVANSDG